MNWKLVVLGGLAMYLVIFVVSFATAMVVHERVLEPAYQQTAEFWRPELRQDPPDMAALMPRWITVGLITSFAFAGLYGWIHQGFDRITFADVAVPLICFGGVLVLLAGPGLGRSHRAKVVRLAMLGVVALSLLAVVFPGALQATLGALPWGIFWSFGVGALGLDLFFWSRRKGSKLSGTICLICALFWLVST